jgi:hypothetical protein
MKRRWLLGLGSLLALGALGFGAWQLMRPASPVTEANYQLIHSGMTKDEVMAILGEPQDYEEFAKTAQAMEDEYAKNSKSGITKRLMAIKSNDTADDDKLGSAQRMVWSHGEVNIYSFVLK